MVVGNKSMRKVSSLDAALLQFLCLLFIFFFQVITHDNEFTYLNFC